MYMYNSSYFSMKTDIVGNSTEGLVKKEQYMSNSSNCSMKIDIGKPW